LELEEWMLWQIKKSLLNSKDFSATCEASQVGACNAEALSTADSIIAHPVGLSTTDEVFIILNKITKRWINGWRSFCFYVLLYKFYPERIFCVRLFVLQIDFNMI
jgi:hypothetical protein